MRLKDVPIVELNNSTNQGYQPLKVTLLAFEGWPLFLLAMLELPPAISWLLHRQSAWQNHLLDSEKATMHAPHGHDSHTRVRNLKEYLGTMKKTTPRSLHFFVSHP